MRYFVEKDDKNKIVNFFRFDPDAPRWTEQIWKDGEWMDDEAARISKQLATGDGDYEEVDKKVVDKWLPKAK